MERGYQENFYALSARVRDAARRQRKAEKIKWVLESFSPRPLEDAVCLDVGCSAGLMTAVVADLCAHTYGLEYDEAALLAVTPEVRAKVDFLRGDAMGLPLPDGCVDLVICAQVYEHVPDAAQLFGEIERVLRPGGVVFFSGPNWLFPIEPHYFLPFLHWLPSAWAARTLRATGLGESYYENSLPIWTLRRLTAAFEVDDRTREVLVHHVLGGRPALAGLVEAMPEWLWEAALPWLPNYNWLLYKPLRR
jgi:SAM-dependent methyltransferase